LRRHPNIPPRPPLLKQPASRETYQISVVRVLFPGAIRQRLDAWTPSCHVFHQESRQYLVVSSFVSIWSMCDRLGLDATYLPQHRKVRAINHETENSLNAFLRCPFLSASRRKRPLAPVGHARGVAGPSSPPQVNTAAACFLPRVCFVQSALPRWVSAALCLAQTQSR
jgi:hypothetical protein